jgi:hypothetical protein
MEELELNDVSDHSEAGIHFEALYYLVEARFHELLHKAHGSADSSTEHGSSSISNHTTHASSGYVK